MVYPNVIFNIGFLLYIYIENFIKYDHMTIYKKDIPIAHLKAIETLLLTDKEKHDKVMRIFPKSAHLFEAVDVDESTGYYFRLSPSDSIDKFKVSRKPANEKTVNGVTTTVALTSLQEFYRAWIKLLEQFKSVKYITDTVDPIVQAYEEELAEYFILEDDADIKPLKLLQQQNLYKLVDTKIESIEILIETASEPDQSELETLLNDWKALKNSISKEPKKTVINLFIKAVSKGMKFSYDLFKDIVTDIASDTIKKTLGLNP